MNTAPPVNRDVDEIPDEAKWAHAKCLVLLAKVQRRLAELAGTGRLDQDHSMAMQEDLTKIWGTLYGGPVDCDDYASYTYSDGYPVMRQWATVGNSKPWEHDRYLFYYGPAVSVCPINGIDVNPAAGPRPGPETPPPGMDAEEWATLSLEARLSLLDGGGYHNTGWPRPDLGTPPPGLDPAVWATLTPAAQLALLGIAAYRDEQ